MRRTSTAVFVLLFASAASGAEVYRCKGKSGATIYSESPCEAGAQPLKLRDSRLAGISEATTTTAADTPGIDADDARDAERSCTASATASIYGPSNDRIAGYQQQLLALRQQLDSAGADNAAAVRARMAALRQSISGEHASAHAQDAAARRRCAQQHRTTGAAPAF
ncbi:DUF4124 domain-containing protein [Stenotrophomonas sp. YIM B06876]|uniref:DUF4124 domain-containing protein n=1 Tax=Stenotrophomonas sp. YIM B06876 TaxID=3060211 RepID=UPI002738DE63|nr:DUF4124 domain-containing protein [Stenotrophomonas sp. YIM B06876]